MTFCVSSAGEFAHWHTPFLLILTHRHGVAVALFLPGAVESRGPTTLPPILKAWLESHGCKPQHPHHLLYLTEVWHGVMAKENTGIFQLAHGCVTVGYGLKTAEHLASTTQQVLDKGGVDWKELGAVVAGLGPRGSFTGLRLGAAYANGLALGLAIPRYQVPSFLTEDLADLDPQMPSNDNHVQCPVRGADVVASLGALASHQCVRMDPLVPLYGALPGPVTLLLERQKTPHV